MNGDGRRHSRRKEEEGRKDKVLFSQACYSFSFVTDCVVSLAIAFCGREGCHWECILEFWEGVQSVCCKSILHLAPALVLLFTMIGGLLC